MRTAKHITALQARRHLGQILEEVHYRGRAYIIERAGREMAAIVPLSLLPPRKKTRNQIQHQEINSGTEVRGIPSSR